jgi:hypothetical protein
MSRLYSEDCAGAVCAYDVTGERLLRGECECVR